MLHLCATVLFSEKLTPQQNEFEVVKQYPEGYKHDRSLACELALEISNQLSAVELVNEDDVKRIKMFLEHQLGHNQNRQQRDLPEKGSKSREPFFHDNEHEYRSTLDTNCTWIGKRPKIPPSVPWDGNYTDPNLPDTYSDGEEFETFNFEDVYKGLLQGEFDFTGVLGEAPMQVDETV